MQQTGGGATESRLPGLSRLRTSWSVRPQIPVFGKNMVIRQKARERLRKDQRLWYEGDASHQHLFQLSGNPTSPSNGVANNSLLLQAFWFSEGQELSRSWRRREEGRKSPF